MLTDNLHVCVGHVHVRPSFHYAVLLETSKRPSPTLQVDGPEYYCKLCEQTKFGVLSVCRCFITHMYHHHLCRLGCHVRFCKSPQQVPLRHALHRYYWMVSETLCNAPNGVPHLEAVLHRSHTGISLPTMLAGAPFGAGFEPQQRHEVVGQPTLGGRILDRHTQLERARPCQDADR